MTNNPVSASGRARSIKPPVLLYSISHAYKNFNVYKDFVFFNVELMNNAVLLVLRNSMNGKTTVLDVAGNRRRSGILDTEIYRIVGS
jgi:hypothetical protein